MSGALSAQQPISDAEFIRNVNQKLDEFQRLYDQKQFEKGLQILQELKSGHIYKLASKLSLVR